MKTMFAITLGCGLLYAQGSLRADEASAWNALDSAADSADGAASTIHWTDSTYLDGIGTTLDLSLQYMDGIVNGGKSRDTNIENMIGGAFGIIDNSLSADAGASDSLATAFDELKACANALSSGEYATAQAEAESAESELYNNTSFYTGLYSTYLMGLESANSDLSTAINAWLNPEGGMGIDPPPPPP